MAGEYNPSPIGNPSLLKRRSWLETQLVRFVGRHTPKCREVVKILSESLDHELPLGIRLKLRTHYLICCWCQRYEQQLHLLRRYAKGFPEQISNIDVIRIPDDAKERIRKRLAGEE